MNKKLIILITLLIAAILAILLYRPNPVKSTEWTDEKGGTLSFEKNTYEWTSGSDTVNGEYTIYRGNAAVKFLDEYKEKCLSELSDIVSDDEKFGVQTEMDNLKDEIKNKEASFVIEMDRVYVVYDQKAGSAEYMTFYDAANNAGMLLEKGVKEMPEKEITFAKKTPNPGIEYKTDLKATLVIDNRTEFSSDDGKINLCIVKMPDVPALGMVDEWSQPEKYKDGYKGSRQMGPYITYAYLYEKNGDTYLITSNDEKTLDNFAESVK